MSSPAGNTTGTVSRYLSIASGLFLCLFMILYPHPPYQDSATAIGDTVDYQTIAVNLAHQNIFPVNGLLLPDTAYHFDIITGYPGAWTASDIHSLTPSYTYARNPLYPLFCGLVYKVCGVHPAILFQVQFLLLILSLAAVPAIGAAIAGYRGLPAGIISGIALFFLTRPYAFEVQTQSLVFPYTIGLWYILVRYLRRTDMRSSIIIAVYLAIGLLLKNFFIPVAILVCLYRVIRSKDLRSLLLPLVIILLILPYTAYLYTQRGTSLPLILLTDQGGDVLLASNNDLTTDGDWHPDGYDLTAFYLQPWIAGKPASLQVLVYICHHPLQTLISMSEKIRLGLLTRWPPVLFLLLLVGAFITASIPRSKRWLFVIVAILFLIAMVSVYLFQRPVFYWGQIWLSAALHGVGIYILLLPLCYFLLRKSPYAFQHHTASWILALSFLALNMIFYGSGRIVGMIDFIGMFYAVLLAWDMIDLAME